MLGLRTGKAAVILSAILLSFGGVGIKVVDGSPMAIAGMRSAWAIPVLLLFIGRSGLCRAYCRWELVGSIAYAVTVLSAVAATRWTTAANAIMLEYASPLWLIVLTWIFRSEDRMRAVDVLFSTACVASLGLIVADQQSDSAMMGNVMGILTGLCMAVFTFAIRRTAQGGVGSPVRIVLVGHVVIAAASIPTLCVEAGEFRSWEILVLAALGVFQIGFADWLYAVGVSRMRALDATLLSMIDPVLNPLIVAVVVREIPAGMAIAGDGLLLCALVIRTLLNSEESGVAENELCQQSVENCPPKESAPRPQLKIGIIGGMGPAASAHFYQLLVRIAQDRFGAEQDNEFPEIFLHSIGLDGFDESGITDEVLVEAQLQESVAMLNGAGADVIVMPCNTVHCLHSSLQERSEAVILNIVDEAAARLAIDGVSNVAIVASATTRKEGLYDAACERHGIAVHHVSDTLQEAVTNVILAGMCGTACSDSRSQIRREIARLEGEQVEAVLLGCTELPLVLDQSDATVPVYDSSTILALATLECAYGKRRGLRAQDQEEATAAHEQDGDSLVNCSTLAVQ